MKLCYLYAIVVVGVVSFALLLSHTNTHNKISFNSLSDEDNWIIALSPNWRNTTRHRQIAQETTKWTGSSSFQNECNCQMTESAIMAWRALLLCQRFILVAFNSASKINFIRHSEEDEVKLTHFKDFWRIYVFAANFDFRLKGLVSQLMMYLNGIRLRSTSKMHPFGRKNCIHWKILFYLENISTTQEFLLFRRQI